MEIRKLENSDFLALLPLVVEMYRAIDKNINEVGAVATVLNDMLSQQDYLVLGMFDEGKLSGFVAGHYFQQNSEQKTFYFSAIYVMIKNKIQTKELIEYAFEYIKSKGYSAWLADATNGNISSILEKYGASIKYTRYYKEL